MTYYRPEWTVGRYYPQHKVAIMYNLMEGNSYFFEDDSASVIGEILSHQRNSAIDTQSLSKCYNIDDVENPRSRDPRAHLDLTL